MGYPLSAVLLAAVLLTACGGPPPLTAPTPLQALGSPAVQPTVLWVSDGGSGAAGNLRGFRLAVQGGTVYVANSGGDVAAFDIASGSQIWRTNVGERLVAGPAVSGNTLLVSTRDGDLLALSASGGERLWSTGVGSEVVAPAAMSNGIAVVHTLDGRLVAYDLADGSRLWTVERGVPSLTMRGVSRPVIRAGRVYAGLDNGHVVAVDLDTGRLLWEQTVALPTGSSELARMADIDADPALAANQLFAVSIGGKLASLLLDNGRVRWKQDIASATGIAFNSDLVFTTDLNGVVHAVSRRTGRQVWTQNALKYRELSAPAMYNGYVVVGDFQGYLHWIDPQTGNIVGRVHALGTAIRQQPVAVNGVLLVLGVGGDLAAVQAGVHG